MKKLTTAGKKNLVTAALEDIKAHDIVAIDVRKITPIFDWIVVASADSGRQTKALARHVQDRLKEAGSNIVGTEGQDSGEWVLVDAGDVIAHVMQPAVRSYYNLEELWGEGKFDPVVNSTVPVRKPAAKKPAAKKPVVKKPVAKKPTPKKKPVARKKTPARKKAPARKKTPARKKKPAAKKA
jgi:ribosome-associated protein